MKDKEGSWDFVSSGILGQGAFSRVYRVESKTDGRAYACKVSGNVKMLEKEAAVMKELQHPLFPEYFGLRQEDGVGFLLMEYVPGSSLEELLKRRGSFNVRQTARVGMELAGGLLHLHGMGGGGILFRDVKPANIMIRQDGRVKLLDFGCVCTAAEGAGSRAGTPGFAAPEQLSGEGRLTAACDVYGLGQTLKAMQGFMPCGKPAAEGRKTAVVCCRKSGRDMRRAQRQLCQILDACTRQQVRERIPDMKEVMAVLASLCPEGGKGGFNAFCRRDVICLKNIWQ